jgi:uncharacterized protein (DUF2236 family)
MSRPSYKEPSSEEVVNRQFLITDQHDNPVVNDNDEVLIGALLDNESITKQNLGKVAYGAEASAGIEQLLHPQIGAAVEYTGKFWRNPYKRVAVSMNPIMAVMYAEDPRGAGDYVRQLHQGISGTDHMGRKFNALSPDAFFWAHETFRSGVEKTADNYSQSALTGDDREQLQLESTTWYSYYGMPMGMVPADYTANLAYRKHMIDNVLEMNPSAERAINMALDRNPPRPEGVPKRVWSLARAALTPVTEMVSLVTIGEMDPAIREKFGIPFSIDDQKRLDEMRTITKAFVDPLPDPLRYSPMAYDALLRERGEHKNWTDRMTYKGLSLGAAAAKNTVGPIVKRAQSVQSKIAA